MAPLFTEPIESDGLSRLRVRTVLDGFTVEYDEDPFEWQAERYFRVRRVMRKGALHTLVMSLAMEPTPGGGSQVRWRLDLETRSWLVAPLTRLVGWWRVGTLARATRELDAWLLAGAKALSDPTVSEGGPLVGIATAIEAALTPDEQATAQRLLAWVASESDDDVLYIRPFALADRWGEDRDRVLTVCLESVVAGLLEMHWDIVCPSCRTGTSRVDHLYELTESGHCNACQIRFELPLDRAVEAIFQPAARVRKLAQGPFCTGGPSSTPHVQAQAHLPSDGAAGMSTPRLPGVYRLFVRGGATASLTIAEGGAATGVFDVVGDALSPAVACLAPDSEITVRQAGGKSCHVKLEQTNWVDQAATAHHLSLDPRFRRRFSGEVLGPGRQLRVARVALLFSDLSGSTALYTKAGDARAFRLVQDHFDLLGGCISAQGGTVVKTMGDAVMAAFQEEGAALRAAIAMQAAWDGFRAARTLAADTFLKLGVHAGPAYVVTANNVLDYFGQTVNITARLLASAQGGEIVVTDALARTAEAAGWLGSAQVAERFDAKLKGLDLPLRSARLVLKLA